jgi:hypothetical protein
LQRVQLLGVEQSTGVAEASLNVLVSKSRIILKYLRFGPTFCKEIYDEFDSETGSFYHWFADQNIWIQNDPFLPIGSPSWWLFGPTQVFQIPQSMP